VRTLRRMWIRVRFPRDVAVAVREELVGISMSWRTRRIPSFDPQL
jgi:hypothetical protein